MHIITIKIIFIFQNYIICFETTPIIVSPLLKMYANLYLK